MDSGQHFPALEEIRNEVGLSPDQMRIGLKALEDASPPYLKTRLTLTGPAYVGGHIVSISERARRELGSWPSPEDLVGQLVKALQDAAEASSERKERSRLRNAAEVIGGMARDIAVQAIAARLGSL